MIRPPARAEVFEIGNLTRSSIPDCSACTNTSCGYRKDSSPILCLYTNEQNRRYVYGLAMTRPATTPESRAEQTRTTTTREPSSPRTPLPQEQGHNATRTHERHPCSIYDTADPLTDDASDNRPRRRPPAVCSRATSVWGRRSPPKANHLPGWTEVST